MKVDTRYELIACINNTSHNLKKDVEQLRKHQALFVDGVENKINGSIFEHLL